MNRTNIEPLLQEDDNRYVCFLLKIMIYGKCIKNKKIYFGEQKKLIYQRYSTMGSVK